MTARIEDRISTERQLYDNGMPEEYFKLASRFSHVFTCPNSIYGDKFVADTLARLIPGKAFLEIGSGRGELMERNLRFGPARAVGIDMYEPFVKMAKDRCPAAESYVMDAHRLQFPDESFDVVFGHAILHHLEYERALLEVMRVLKPGGVVIFDEPLGDNPGAKIYRWLTPKARTPDEVPISRKKILWADERFSAAGHCFTGLFSAGIGMVTSFTPLKADNTLLRSADRIDRWMARTPLRYWMRRVALVWTK